jgi:hypothetical protein
MTLNTECYKLPLRFDSARLAEELSQFEDQDWISLSGDALGDTAIILISVGGTLNQDFAISGPLAATAFLERCAYIKQILKNLNSPISRCRLVRIKNTTETQAQVGCHYHWFRHNIICIPIVTNPTVKLFCDDNSIQMATGKAWTFDTRQAHWMCNEAEQACIHLIIETSRLPSLGEEIPPAPREVETAQIPLEPYRFEVLTPQEIEKLTDNLLSAIKQTEIPQNNFLELTEKIDEFKGQWAQAFSKFGHQSAGELTYQNLILSLREQVTIKANKWLRKAEASAKCAFETIISMLLIAPPGPKKSRPYLKPKKRKLEQLNKDEEFQCPTFEKPVFLVSAPRAGSTLLFDSLSQFQDVWSIGDESHETIEGIEGLHPSAKNYSSNRLTEAEAQPHVLSMLQKRFTQELQDRNQQVYLELPISKRPSTIRFLEKTPKNALRIPFIKALFPNALFLYLYRDPRENINSMMEGWRARSFVPYRTLPGWSFKYWAWNFLLIPGWSDLQDKPIVEIAARQWEAANTYILDDLKNIPTTDFCIVPYTELIQEPKKIMTKISQFAGFHWDQQIEQRVSQSLPVSRMTLSAPSPGKWRKREKELSSILPIVEPIEKRFEQLLMENG